MIQCLRTLHIIKFERDGKRNTWERHWLWVEAFPSTWSRLPINLEASADLSCELLPGFLAMLPQALGHLWMEGLPRTLPLCGLRLLVKLVSFLHQKHLDLGGLRFGGASGKIMELEQHFNLFPVVIKPPLD